MTCGPEGSLLQRLGASELLFPSGSQVVALRLRFPKLAVGGSAAVLGCTAGLPMGQSSMATQSNFLVEACGGRLVSSAGLCRIQSHLVAIHLVNCPQFTLSHETAREGEHSDLYQNKPALI